MVVELRCVTAYMDSGETWSDVPMFYVQEEGGDLAWYRPPRWGCIALSMGLHYSAGRRGGGQEPGGQGAQGGSSQVIQAGSWSHSRINSGIPLVLAPHNNDDGRWIAPTSLPRLHDDRHLRTYPHPCLMLDISDILPRPEHWYSTHM